MHVCICPKKNMLQQSYTHCVIYLYTLRQCTSYNRYIYIYRLQHTYFPPTCNCWFLSSESNLVLTAPKLLLWNLLSQPLQKAIHGRMLITLHWQEFSKNTMESNIDRLSDFSLNFNKKVNKYIAYVYTILYIYIPKVGWVVLKILVVQPSLTRVPNFQSPPVSLGFPGPLEKDHIMTLSIFSMPGSTGL